MNEHMGANRTGRGSPGFDHGRQGKFAFPPFQGFLDDVAVVSRTDGSLVWQNRTLVILTGSVVKTDDDRQCVE